MRWLALVLLPLVVPVASAAPAPGCPADASWTFGGETAHALVHQGGAYVARDPSDGNLFVGRETNGWDGFQLSDRYCVYEDGTAFVLYRADERVATLPACVGLTCIL